MLKINKECAHLNTIATLEDTSVCVSCGLVIECGQVCFENEWRDFNIDSKNKDRQRCEPSFKFEQKYILKTVVMAIGN